MINRLLFNYFLLGSTSAALTTPFDVIKTRIMLSHISQKRVKISDTMREVYKERGIKGYLLCLLMF